MQTPQSLDILGIKFSIVDYDKTLEIFKEWVDIKAVRQVCFVNVHTLVSSLSDMELRTIYNNAWSTMDGLPLVWYANRILGAHLENRVSGPDLMLKCLDQGRSWGWKHFFLGGTQQVVDHLAGNMQMRFPGINIAGWHSPPFRPLSSLEDQQLVDLINTANPDFLWVGLGAPKQEKWIAAHLDRIHTPIQLGVGAAFDFHSGHVSRAPLWMQKNGLEWLYRMLKDRRLINRYLTTNTVFMLLFARDYFFIRLLKRKPNFRSGKS